MRSPAIVDLLQGAVSAYGGKASIQLAQEFRVFALADRDRQRRLVDLCPRERHLTRIESGGDDCTRLVIKRRRVCLACDEASQTFLVTRYDDQFYFRGSSLNDSRERLCRLVRRRKSAAIGGYTGRCSDITRRAAPDPEPLSGAGQRSGTPPIWK